MNTGSQQTCTECEGTGRRYVGPDHWVLCDACGGHSDFTPESRRLGKGPHPLSFRLLSLYLICNFLWRSLATAHEYPLRPTQVMTMVFDLACIILLIAFHKLYPGKSTSWLFWIALLCGLGLFAIRFHGDASWWTGHWNYDWRR